MKYSQEESSVLEFKREFPKNDQLIKTIIGFCNRFGGKIVIGVENDGTIIGIDEQEAENILEYLDKSIYEATTPPILPLVYTRRIGESTLLYVEVSSGMNKPYYKRSEGMEQGTYIRLGRSTMRANLQMIEELKWISRGIDYEKLPVHHATSEDLDLKKVEKFLHSRKNIPPIGITEEVLFGYKILVKEHGITYPSVAGVLLFGKNPQHFFSEAMIICTRFSGTSGREVIATRDCNGTLFEQFQNAYNFMTTHLDKAFTIQGPQREEVLELPEKALREILLNLLVHRNYHITAPAKIAIYDNRMEIFSPGDFPGPLNPNELMKGLTFLRNPLICRIFREGQFIEKMGTGFITLFNSFEERGLKKPEVIEENSLVKCILPREKMIKLENEDTQQILELFSAASEITISDVVKFLNLSRSTAGRRLTKLQKMGLIIKQGQGKGARYRLVK